jgi:Kef-type K+ transport system membrane component KefB
MRVFVKNSEPDVIANSPHQGSGLAQHVTSPGVFIAIAAIATLIIMGMIPAIRTIGQLWKLGHDGGLLLVKCLIAVVLITAVGSLGGWAAACFRQPRVVGEMVAGITLGPSLLGHFSPAAQNWLFPSVLIPHLSLIAQVTIIVFVFLLGAHLPLELLYGSGRRVAVLGIGMVSLPLACGILLAVSLSKVYRPDGVSLVSFLLFIGVAMAVTAFPVLVRILAEHDLTKSRIGALGLIAAGIGDAIAWCLLVVVVATAHSVSAAKVILTVTLLIVFIVAIWTVLRPALGQFLEFAERKALSPVNPTVVLLLSAVSGGFITNWIGVHALFGAFLVGMAVPRENSLIKDLTRTIERRIYVALPLFFAVIGLNVQIGFLGNPHDLLMCALMIVVAMASKIGATMFIARLTKLTWRDSLGLGVMMNCRGLTELVVASMGLSLGIIEPNLFAMFVIMTLVTTVMTGPLLGWLKLDKGPALTQPAGVELAPPVEGGERPDKWFV